MGMIKRLIIKDCLGIEECAINLGHVTKISGGNEKGKTSILEAIEKALYNSQRRARFVRNGADKAYIELETTDGLRVKRMVVRDDDGNEDTKVKVTVDNVPKTAPESFLKELFGVTSRKGGNVFAFNPVDFMGRPEAEQTNILLSLLPISVSRKDLAEWFGALLPKHINPDKHGLLLLKELEEYFYEARREANSILKATIAEADAVAKRLPDNYDVAKWTEVNLADLYNAVTRAQETNARRKAAQNTVNAHLDKKEGVKARFELRRKEARETAEFRVKKQAEAIEDKKEAIRERIAGLKADIAKLQAALAVAETELVEIGKGTPALDDSIQREVEAKLSGINELEKSELDALEAEFRTADNYLNAAPQDEPVLELKAKALEAEQMKAYLPLAQEVKHIMDRAAEDEKRASALNAMVNLCRAKPKELLSACELPVKGLGIDRSGLTIDDLPLKNLSTSKQVRVCLDIARAIAKNNPLKLICVDRLESLDTTIRAEFMGQIEADETFQYVVTVVTEGDLKVESK